MKNTIIEIENILLKYFLIRAQEFGYSKETEWKDNLLETGILDSVEIVALISFTELTFGIKWKDDDIQIQNLSSISNLANFIRCHAV